ncbi:MAG TPA: ribosome biogenesis GTPase Der [Patescibacteria group bacterium]|nr:ribosome biogenesis GTPase Der [Patescibacteria group bacterium]
MSRPLVAIVGRTNVGKSTLWNRLTETSHAIVSSDLHTTRDRRFGTVLWHGAAFEIVDTGGMDTESDEIGRNIRAQAENAIKQADLILFVIDAKSGILPQDQTLAREVKKFRKPVWLMANKTDTLAILSNAHESSVFQLNFGAPHSVSATTSFGIGDFLDELVVELDRLGHPAEPVEEKERLKIAIIGRPNVGKSSLTNAILGEERVIVSPIPHTTREPQDTNLVYKDHELTLVDTAGVRQLSRASTKIEEASIARNEQAIKSADIALLVFDATEAPSAQDRRLAGLLEDANKGLILVANKWDLVEQKSSQTATEYELLIRQLFPFLDWAPVMFVSALTGQRVTHLLDQALAIQQERLRHIDYNALNRLLKSCIKAKRPLQSYGPKSPRIYDAAQIGHAPPTFLITVHGEKDNIHPSWLKFFEKRLRDKFGYKGTPIQVKARHIPVAKSQKKWNVHGPGMEAVAGKIREKKPRVNQTRRRQKHGGRRY